MMNLTERKKAIWNDALASHKEVIDNYATSIKELQSSVTTVGEENYDNSTIGQQSETFEQISHLREQLDFAKEELDLMNRMELDHVHQQVQLGSVVETDKRIFFLSVSVEEFESNGEKLFGLSLKSPLGMAMLGKKRDDSFSYGDTTYTIKSLY